MAKTVVTGAALLVIIVVGLWLSRDDGQVLPVHGDPATEQTSSRDALGVGAKSPEARAVETSRFDTVFDAIPDLSSLDPADRDLDVAGRVVDEGGRPVAGALVETFRFPWRRVPLLDIESVNTSVSVAQTRSSHEGYFILRHRRSATVELRVTAAGFAPCTVPRCMAGIQVTVTLKAATPFTIVARDEGQRPVLGVAVEFRARSTTDLGAVVTERRLRKTNAEGVCLFDDLEAGPGGVTLTHETLGSVSESIHVVRGEENLFAFVLPTGRSIRGRVTDAETGLPIEGATVGAGWVFHRPVTTDVDGRYAYPGWTGKGLHDIHVRAEGCGRTSRVVGDLQAIDFALMTGADVTGRVLSSKGTPVSDALVNTVASELSRDGQRRQEIDHASTTSGSDGSFRLASLRHDLPHTLVLQSEGHARYLLDFEFPADGDGSLDLGDIRLPEPRAIEGRVLDGAGNPVTDTTVTLEGWNADRTRLRGNGSVAAGRNRYGASETRRVDDLGRFRFPDLAPGEYRIESRRAGSLTIRKTVALAEADVVDLVFLYDEGPSMTIKVQDDGGRPVEGVFLTVSWPGVADGVSERTDVEGTASLRAPVGAGPGKLQVSLVGKPYVTPEPQEVPPGSGTTVITLARAATVEGQIVDVAGKGLPGMRMASLRNDGVVGQSVSDSEGRFSLSLKFGDPVDLELTGRRYPVGPNPGPGEATPLRGRVAGVIPPARGVVLTALEDPRNRSLTVLVVDRSGAPLDGVLVSCSPLWFTLSGGGQGRTNDAGRVLLENLGWESVDLSAELPRGATDASPAVVRVIPDGQVVTLRGRPATLVGGWVLLPDGTPAIGASVSISKPGEDDARVKTDGVGRFTARVAAGHAYDITAHLRDPAGGTELRGSARDVRDGNRVTIRLEQTQD